MLVEPFVVGAMTRDVWTALLGLEAVELPANGSVADASSSPESSEQRLTACVDIEGSWRGTVTIAMPLELATKLATRMLNCQGREPSASEVRDVLGELTHVLGGNVKGALPGSCALSMPRVELVARGAPSKERALWFACDGECFSVSVKTNNRSGS